MPEFEQRSWQWFNLACQGVFLLLAVVLAGDPSQTVAVHRIIWNEQQNRVSRLRVELLRGQLRERIEAVLKAPLAEARSISDEASVQLMTSLMDLTAQGQ